MKHRGVTATSRTLVNTTLALGSDSGPAPCADVKAAGPGPLLHSNEYGAGEGRTAFAT